MRFDLIYADPPWAFRDKCNAGKRGAVHKYPVLSTRDLMFLPLHQIAEVNAALALWVPSSMLPDALALMEIWGFKYKTMLFTWRKVTARGDPAWGMGHWTRQNVELCLLGTRGRPKRLDAGVHQEVSAPRTLHSAKPPEVRARLERLFGDVRRLELFARVVAPGWHALGDEIDGRDIRESLPALAAQEGAP